MSAELAWAAGLFEGEGSTFMRGKQQQPVVVLQMTDEDVVRRFAAVFGRGKVRAYQPAGNRKLAWRWSVQGREDVLTVLGQLWPLLGERRQQRATEVIERTVKIGEPRHGGGHQSTGLCKRGHDLSDPQHLYVHVKSGKRHCRTCRIDYGRRRLR